MFSFIALSVIPPATPFIANCLKQVKYGIYLLGSTVITRHTESIFNTHAPAYGHAGHYYILVLVSDKEIYMQRRISLKTGAVTLYRLQLSF